MVKVGLQLYSVRRHMEMNPIETLEQVAEAGYRYIETANHMADKDCVVGFGLSAEEVNSLMRRLGACIVSGHVSPLDPRSTDHIKRVMEQQKAIGLSYIATNLHDFPNREITLYYADFLNRLGEVCREYGIQLLYHNHFAEFRQFDGQSAYDIIMENTNPELLQIQLDTYWVMRGGVDPLAVMKQYGKRVRIIHQKDYPIGMDDRCNLLYAFEKQLREAKDIPEDTAGRGELSARELDERILNVLLADVEPKSFVEIGTGIMDIQSIINAANDICGADYVILEQDHTQLDELDSIRLSMANFRKCHGISWA